MRWWRVGSLARRLWEVPTPSSPYFFFDHQFYTSHFLNLSIIASFSEQQLKGGILSSSCRRISHHDPLKFEEVHLIYNRHGFPTASPRQQHRRLLHSLISTSQDCERSLDSLVPLFFSSPKKILKSQYLEKWERFFSQLGNFSNRQTIIEKVLEHSARFQLDPVKSHEILDFLGTFQVSDAVVGEILEASPWLMFLDCQVDLEPKVKVLKDAGIREESIIRMLTKSLSKLASIGLDELVLELDYLMGLGLSKGQLDEVLYEFPDILGLGVDARLKPLVSELERLGFQGDKCQKAIMDDPRVFGMEIGGELSRCFNLLKNLKCRPLIKARILDHGAIRACVRVKTRVDCLCKHGLNHREAFKLLEREPRIITYDLSGIEQKIDFLLNRMGYSIGSLMDAPEYLGVNFEKQIVPRYRVIEYLRSKGGLGFNVDLRCMMKLTRRRFCNLFVKPYPECEKLYGSSKRGMAAETRKSLELWKLFKPEKFPESKEDIKNIKQFMESII
ncbi:transcription termination factor MTERF15, mitochondrial [Amborella trichopoda]|uniref:Uncharacterized protein n=1 Tax=Amborella trichopoda TaxID=13333 RepID=W1NJB1_AMBTC|nr:transcription termination factor MTERF15, mitochondrial [Amborella trichopoda]XP_011625655.1 transcription termination factor MTERF15, mitochondrial [Amborella trichopoda]XP_020525673.1 transcription termination factor MTERF15, mitochondrial [Amborella trichopoda]XP_020525678.1 transcription termination factor MTERF15, mitochondrial [Amborella trichopoda]XP_020525680.1 transcription termination factor MTERF15, mitochondrial [Amborella trichopoda]ERM95245.1 hypothetical protein AMTR_s00009p0|eukprot:XP_006827829.1 transcription termination factor MTERF15, mitochondrial [Amborella trichopoda]